MKRPVLDIVSNQLKAEMCSVGNLRKPHYVQVTLCTIQFGFRASRLKKNKAKTGTVSYIHVHILYTCTCTNVSFTCPRLWWVSVMTEY
jgi:hypothetical protein